MAQDLYFPPAGQDWEQRSPDELGFDETSLEEAVDFAVENENSVEFGLEDWGDRPPQDGGIDEWRYRELHEPGTHFKQRRARKPARLLPAARVP